MNLSQIKPYGKNAKKHPKKQVEQIAASIKEFGFNQPIVVDKNGTIIVGHGRYEAAKLLGIHEPPTITVDLTEEQAKSYRLADNKLNESDWDMDLVIEELKGLTEPYLELTGFDKDLIIEPDEKDDVIPENVPARTKLGDLYELGSHRVLCGDSCDFEAVSRLMDDVKADMVFTDPPYGMKLDADYSKRDSGRGNLSSGFSRGSLKRHAHTQVIGDDKDYDPTHIFNFFPNVKEMFLWGADYYAERIPNRNDGSWIIWDKRAGIENVKFTLSEFETCWSKNKHSRELARVKWFGIMGLEKEDIKRRVHPTQKPVELCNWFITKYSIEDAILVDLFMGSGSTLISCEKSRRICYGMELDPKYIDVIVQRYVDYTGNDRIKLNGQEITWQK